MPRHTLQLNPSSPFRRVVGVGGIGTGLFFALQGQHTLGRNESRPAHLLANRDYYKLHIICHYIAVLLGAKQGGRPFHVVPIAKIGGDITGRQLIDEMIAVGIDVRHIDAVSGLPTPLSVCFQYPDGSGGNITANEPTASALTRKDIDDCAELLACEDSRCIALAAPEAPLELREYFLDVATDQHAFRAASFASSEMEAAQRSGMFAHIDLLAINEDEAGALVGETFNPLQPWPFLHRCAAVLTHLHPHIWLIVSAGQYGAFAFAEGDWDYCPPASVQVASTAGAGDALLAGVLSSLAVGLPLIKPGPVRASLSDRPLESAFELGVLLATYSITSPHTIHPDADVETLLSFGDTLGIRLSKRILQYREPDTEHTSRGPG